MNKGVSRLSMADRIASALAQNLDSMPLLAHLEELRKRTILSVVGVVVAFFSCWSFADRIFALMQQPIIQALRHHGLSGGLVYLNPTEPFNLYMEVGFVAGLFVASPFVFYQLWLFVAPGLYRKEKRYVLPFLVGTVALFLAGGLFGYRMDRLRPTLPTDDHDWGIHKGVSNDHHRTRSDFRNAHSRVLPRSDAGDYGALDVAKSAIFHTCHFCSCSNRHTYHGHFEHVPFCCTDGRALRNEHRSGLAGEPLTDAENVMSPIMILLDVKLRKCGRHSGR